jgi:hypothetical protein
VDGQSGAQAWADRFDGGNSDLLVLQDQIADRIANSVGREIFVAAVRDRETRRVNPKAFDILMRGIAAGNLPQSLDGLQEQERLFTRATELDQMNGDAQARLARAILLQATHVQAPAY